MTHSSHKCPHCGTPVRVRKNGWTYKHAFRGETCPGSWQHPRNIHDHRPLWKDADSVLWPSWTGQGQDQREAVRQTLRHPIPLPGDVGHNLPCSPAMEAAATLIPDGWA